jgi:hypothetical protein
MCRTCWALVPPGVQRAVYAAFDPAQCSDTPNRPAPSGYWMVSAKVAMLANGLRRAPASQIRNPRTREQLAVSLGTSVAYCRHKREEPGPLLELLAQHLPADLALLREVVQDAATRQGALALAATEARHG